MSKSPKLIGQVLLVVFLLAVLGAQVVLAQDLPPCTNSLLDLPEYENDGDGIDQAVDVDKNDNGLIEICDLEGLYEMRYVLDGSGYRPDATATTNTTGCPTRGCTGFELTRNLSFTDNDSYRTTANRVIYTVGNYDDANDRGWEPIGRIIIRGRITFSNPFNTKFEGNGHTISNLMINNTSRPFQVGLFGFVGAEANIANVGLTNVRIIGEIFTPSLSSLVGQNRGTIMNSYATGFVSGDDRVGGLVGQNRGSITNSYATGTVEGDTIVGGLAGENRGTITNSYAVSTVSGNNNVGDLVGLNTGGSIMNSYATGSNTLVNPPSDSITNSSKTTVVQLQTPTAATGIYSSWSIEVWDFGTRNNLPTLRNVPEIELVRVRAKVFLEGPLQ